MERTDAQGSARGRLRGLSGATDPTRDRWRFALSRPKRLGLPHRDRRRDPPDRQHREAPVDEEPAKETLTSLRAGSTDARAVEAYYDDWADGYDATLKEWRYRAPADAAGLMAPHLADGARVLDVGCGTGLLGAALRAHAAVRLAGIDISAASLEQAGRRGLYDRLLRHDLTQIPLPVPDHTFDAAACIGVLTYIADAEALLRDMCRTVRTGGVVAFTQRTDLWNERRFDSLIARLEAEGLWQRLHQSPPMPYLPGNTDFAEEIGVIHTLCRVI